MRTNFLLEELLLENRLEDVKKKYPEIDSITIEQLASRDPSGNNKYLDWMVKQKKSGSLMPSIIKYVNLFHKNVNKLTKDFFDELIKEKKWEWLLTGNSPIEKSFQKIYKSPKDINNYEDFDLTSQILNTADSKLSKSEVKKLEANILYNSDDLLIMIPKSHRASCYYGSGTKWCTTSKESQTHYNKYTTDGTLIYVINKKEPESNPWYKTAFHIYKVNGNSTAYNAPDVPTEIKVAAEKLGSNWETIRDVIVEYLYKNNLKGIDNFYFGRDLITWLESKNIDPLKSLSPEQLLEKLGVWGEATADTFISYLKKRNVNMYEYLPYNILFKIAYITTKNPDLGTVVKNVWDGYKNAGINPLIKMFTTRNDITQVVEGVRTGKISLDDFLHLCSDPNFSNIRGQNGNIFSILKDFYSSGGTNEGSLIAVLLRIFQEDTKLIFGYAKTIGVNLFSILAPIEMNELLNRSFQFEDALKYTLKNIDFLKGRPLTYYGFPTKEVLEYISKQPNKIELFERLVSENLLGNLKLNEIYVFIKNKEETLKLWFQENYYGKLPEGDDIIPSIKDFLTTSGPKINEVFPNLESFESAVKKIFNLENFDAFSLTDVGSKIRTTTNSRILLKAFFNNNFYEFYKYFLTKTTVDNLDTLLLIKAYEDAPVDEETGLKKLVLERARKEMVGRDYDCKLETKTNVDYVVFSDLTRVLGLFDNYGDYDQILSGDISDLITDFTTIDFSDVIYFLDNDIIVKIIKDYLFNNFRERNITLNLDWLEEFGELGNRVKIDDVKGTFSFVLYDEIIEGLSNYKLLSLVENSPQFKKLRDILEKVYKEVFNQEILSDTKNELISTMEDIFGRDFMRPKKAEVKKGPKSSLKIEKTVYEFRYDYLMDDIIAFANRYVFYEEELPTSVYGLIQGLMENGDGRFSGPASINLEQFVEYWDPYQNKEKFTENFTETLSQTLSKPED